VCEVFKTEQIFWVLSWHSLVMDNYLFQAICVRVSDEKDPRIVELFKQRLRLLLRSEEVNPISAREHIPSTTCRP